MTKYVFGISTLVLVLLIGAIFIYNFAFKKPPTQTATTKVEEEGKTNLVSSQKNEESEVKQTTRTISAISDTSVFGATLAPDRKTIYFFNNLDGQINQIDFSGKLEKVISIEPLQGIRYVGWNNPKNKAIIKQADASGKLRLSVFDLTEKKIFLLNENIDYASWSGFGDKILYKYFDPKTRKNSLNFANPDGSNWQKITDIDYFSVSISAIPGSADISFWPNPDAFTPTSANIINLSGENKKEILKDRWGVDLLWSPDGKYIAVSYADQKGGHKTDIALVNSDGGQFYSLNFPTFVKKCTWSADSKYLYCAMPGNMPETAILPNDWQEQKITSADTFWKIEIATGKKDRLIETDKINGIYDVLSPFLSPDEKIFFFINKIDGRLYKLDL